MLEKKVKQLEEAVNSLKEKKIRTEEQLKSLRAKRTEIFQELDILGVVPKDLDNVINTLKIKIDAELTEIDMQIPKNMLQKENEL